MILPLLISWKNYSLISLFQGQRGKSFEAPLHRKTIKTLNTFTGYTAASNFTATTIDENAKFKPSWATPNTDDRDFKWFAYSSPTMKASGDETGHLTGDPVEGVTGLVSTAAASWKIFVLYDGSVEKIH